MKMKTKSQLIKINHFRDMHENSFNRSSISTESFEINHDANNTKSLKTLLEQSLGKDSQGSGQGNTRQGSGGVKKCAEW